MKKPGRFSKLAIAVVLLLLAVTFLPALAYRKLANHNPLPSGFSKGVDHVHSTFSDGKGDLAEIASEAAVAGLDFVLLTDHGTPNRRSATATEWVHDVLVVGGSELDLKGQHMTASGFSAPPYRYPPEPQTAIDEVSRSAGVSFIAHPFYPGNPWTEWDVTGHTGVELINAHTSFSRPGVSKLFLVPRYFVRPDYALLTGLEYPEANVEVWDEMNLDKRHFGIFALDAHARLSVGFGRYVNLPTYRAMFSLLNVYVKHGVTLGDEAEVAAATIVRSLRAGSFFNCIEAIAPCNGFEAVFESDSGEHLEMGGASPSHAGRLVISLPFAFATDVIVKRNGEIFREFERNRERELAVAISDAGVYRVEVFARASTFDHLPWIMSNPFFLATVPAPEERPRPTIRQKIASGPGFFRTECDPTTECSRVEDEPDGGAFVTALHYRLPERPTTRDYFAALANREVRSLTGFEGLILRVRADQRALFWLMFRTAEAGSETWYRHSFAADHEWSTVAVPFATFRVHHGEVRPPDLEAVTSLFISIDNQIAYPSASGALFVSDLGLY